MSAGLKALLFGTTVGVLVQWVATVLHYNGRWDTLSTRKKIALVAAGGVAALASGLWSLGNQQDSAQVLPPHVYYRMWFWQVVAAWGGAIFLDRLSSFQLSKLTGQEERRK